MSNIDNLYKLDYNKMFENIDITKLQAPETLALVNVSKHAHKPPTNLLVEQQKQTNYLIKDLNEQVSELQDELTNMNSELKKQTYENMKLNAQITVLNKTIDSKDEELNKLTNINNQLELTNKVLLENQESNRGYWIKTILIGIFTTIFAYLLGKY